MKRVTLVGALCLTAACSAAPPQAAADAGQAQQPKVEAYTPPKEGTPLVSSIAVRRNAGQVMVDGKTLLPAGTRVWIDLYASNARPDADPVGHAELYLSPGGAFEVGPFKDPGGAQAKVIVTSHFSRS